MLETVREFALEQLATAGETEVARTAHAAYTQQLVARAAPEPVDGVIAPDWLSRLDDERGNVRAALSWWLWRGESVPALATAGALVEYWSFRNDFAEGRSWCERALALAVDVTSPTSRLSSLYGACVLASTQGDHERAVAAGEAMLHAARVGGNDVAAIRAHYALCHAARLRGDHEQARSHALAAIAQAREAVLPIWLAWTLTFVGGAADIVGEEQAEAAATEALDLFRELGSEWGQANALHLLATFASDRGELAHAASLLGESLALREASGERFGAIDSLLAAADLAARQGHLATAARLLGVTEAWANELRARRSGRDNRLDEVIASVRARLGDAEFAALHAEGAAMPRAAALDKARALLAEIAATERGHDATPPEVPRAPDRHGMSAWSESRVTPSGPFPTAPARTRSASAGGLARFSRRPAPPIDDLTRREREVLGLLCERLTNPEIADRLYIGTRTVEFHVANILGKLGAEDRRQAAAIAARHGLV
jgi:DNA-binding CsgD family transcriptional regulator